MLTFIPVSYTHLDVYKRQDVDCRRNNISDANQLIYIVVINFITI